MSPRQIFLILNGLVSGIDLDRFKLIFGEKDGETLHKEFIRYDFNLLNFYNNRLNDKQKADLHKYLIKTNTCLHP